MVYKEKLRIRSYQKAAPSDPVFVELKKKYQSMVYKRRLTLPEAQVMHSFQTGQPLPVQSQIAEEIAHFRTQYQKLKPSVFLSYEREAFYALDGSGFRVTFDENILYRQRDVSLGSAIYGTPILSCGQMLMEIKCAGGMPLWMCRALHRAQIYQTSFSKYGRAYQDILQKEKHKRSIQMFANVFQGIFDTDMTQVIALSDFLLCVCSTLAIGWILAGFYMYRAKYTKSFVATLALLPAVVCVVIMMVNGNVGTGVAVAGAFSLVRFRSVPGSAKEIGAIFLAMGTGLIVGMGYIGYAFLCAVLLFGAKKQAALYKTLRITIPEDLDYTDVFVPILQEYTSAHELTQVRTTNMGSLFKLTYDITLRSAGEEKQMIDKLRCRNGNLEISISNQETNTSML